MRGGSTLFIILAAIIVTATGLSLVTSIASLAMPSGVAPGVSVGLQELTSTPEGDLQSQAGSTDGIVWMGIVISGIILLPLLTRRALWQR